MLLLLLPAVLATFILRISRHLLRRTAARISHWAPWLPNVFDVFFILWTYVRHITVPGLIGELVDAHDTLLYFIREGRWRVRYTLLVVAPSIPEWSFRTSMRWLRHRGLLVARFLPLGSDLDDANWLVRANLQLQVDTARFNITVIWRVTWDTDDFYRAPALRYWF